MLPPLPPSPKPLRASIAIGQSKPKPLHARIAIGQSGQILTYLAFPVSPNRSHPPRPPEALPPWSGGRPWHTRAKVLQLGFRQAFPQVRGHGIPPVLEAPDEQKQALLIDCQPALPIFVPSSDCCTRLNLFEDRKVSLKGEASYPYSLTKSINALNATSSKPKRLSTPQTHVQKAPQLIFRFTPRTRCTRP